jgi:hypothetical protein
LCIMARSAAPTGCRMCKAYKKGRNERRDATVMTKRRDYGFSADESRLASRADPGTGESERTASAAEGTLGRGTRRGRTSTNYGGPERRQTPDPRRRRADDGGELEQTRRARRGKEQDFAEISRRMYEEIRSSSEAGTRGTIWKMASARVPHREDDPG